MSLDDLFSLLLFALFIGAPLLSRFFRRGGQGPTGKAPPQTRTGLPTTPPTASSPSKRDATKSAAENAANDIGERLEQARRRVREAVEGQTARTDTRSARTSSQTPQATGLESAGDMFQQSQPARPPAPPPRQVTSTFAATDASVRRSQRTPTRPLQVERSGSGKRARLSPEMLAFSRDDIMRGIMWQQILDAPKSKRPWRNPSQHP